MDIIKLSDGTYYGALSLVERTLLSGGIVISPTDTVYGILGNATNEEVVKKIFALKKRAEKKALPIFVKDIATVRKLAYISDVKTRFLEKVWPGPVTVIFHHKEKMSSVLTGGLSTLGTRIPDNPFLRQLLARLPFPLVQTSANISRSSPVKNLEEIKKCFGDKEMKPDLVIDGGELDGKSSVVIDFTGDRPLVLRTGILSPDELDELLSYVR